MSTTTFIYALIQEIEKHLGVKTFQHFTEPSYGVDFVLRHKTLGLPVGGFLLCSSPPDEALKGWAILNKELIRCPVYAINSERWFKTGELEMVQMNIKDNKNIHFKTIEPVQASKTDNNSQSGQVSQQGGNAPLTPQSFPVRVNKWEKQGKKRFYVNGNGFQPEEKANNLKTIFAIETDGQQKVYVENGIIKVWPNTPIKPEAEQYIKSLIK